MIHPIDVAMFPTFAPSTFPFPAPSAAVAIATAAAPWRRPTPPPAPRCQRLPRPPAPAPRAAARRWDDGPRRGRGGWDLSPGELGQWFGKWFGKWWIIWYKLPNNLGNIMIYVPNNLGNGGYPLVMSKNMWFLPRKWWVLLTKMLI